MGYRGAGGVTSRPFGENTENRPLCSVFTVVSADARSLACPAAWTLPRNQLALSAAGGASLISPQGEGLGERRIATGTSCPRNDRMVKDGLPRRFAARNDRCSTVTCHSEEPVRRLVTWESVIPRRERIAAGTSCPRNDRMGRDGLPRRLRRLAMTGSSRGTDCHAAARLAMTGSSTK